MTLSDFLSSQKMVYLVLTTRRRDSDFISLDHNDGIAQHIWGVHGTFKVNEKSSLKLKYEDFEADDGRKTS